ncbi:MFS transporter [Pseudomonas sp. NPDC088368]|uniref:MFS transporter n=1 Tax=Pseudomonas sp. NPDC088368 TaxID=3364453 RepID=UPI00381B9B7A
MDQRLLILALGMFALGTDSFVVAGVLPQIAHSFDISLAAAGQMMTVYALTYALLAPLIATFAASVPRKQLLLSGLAIFVIANLGTAMAPTFTVALATRALAGLGGAMFSPTATSTAVTLMPPERRGFAISILVAGMTISTALGSPIGAVIGGLGDWHLTMLFVAALAAVAGVGVLILLSDIPLLPAVSLTQRLAPLADARIGLTLFTTLLFFSGVFTIYTYFSLVFEQAISGSPIILGGLLVLWGVAGTVSNLLTGRLVDRIGSRRVLNTMLLLVVVNFLLLPWTGVNLWTATVAVLLWGACGWGISVPQQHRIIGIAPPIAPIVIGLNNSATFLGATVAGLAGATGIKLFGGQSLSLIAAVLVGAALVFSELAARRIARGVIPGGEVPSEATPSSLSSAVPKAD